VLALLGVYVLVGAVIGLVVQPSMSRLIEDVHRGTLDFVLTRPEDAQLLVSIRQLEVWRLTDVALGLSVLTVALLRQGRAVGPQQALSFDLALLCGGAIVYSVWLILATCSFWLARVGNILGIFQSLYETGRWPVAIYPAWLRWALTFLVPVAFAVSVPAEALTGRLAGRTLVSAVALAGVLLLASRRFWMAGLRRYSGASA
jgi:ABC-2 type transport system permease protein